MRDLDEVFQALSQSPFRRRMRLDTMLDDYLNRRGLSTVMQHAADFVERRLASAAPRNDGHQTPMGGHPVFVAQHATATCCRKCLAKWHRIAEGRALSANQKAYVLQVIERWLAAALRDGGRATPFRNSPASNSPAESMATTPEAPVHVANIQLMVPGLV